MGHREITGSLAERNGRYTAILNLYDEDGKRRQKSIALGIPVKGNKRKAQARLEELKREYSTGSCSPAKSRQESPLFADFLHDWLKTTAPTIERTTYQSYQGLIDARLDSFFRERRLRLQDLEAKHIRELHQSIFKDGCNANKLLLEQHGLRHIRFHDLRHPYVKHTTKKYNSEKQKTQATKMDLIAWVFRFCIFNYSKRSWTL